MLTKNASVINSRVTLSFLCSNHFTTLCMPACHTHFCLDLRSDIKGGNRHQRITLSLSQNKRPESLSYCSVYCRAFSIFVCIQFTLSSQPSKVHFLTAFINIFSSFSFFQILGWNVCSAAQILSRWQTSLLLAVLVCSLVHRSVCNFFEIWEVFCYTTPAHLSVTGARVVGVFTALPLVADTQLCTLLCSLVGPLVDWLDGQSVCLFIHPSVRLSVCMSVRLSVCSLSICPSICLFVCPSVTFHLPHAFSLLGVLSFIPS